MSYGKFYSCPTCDVEIPMKQKYIVANHVAQYIVVVVILQTIVIVVMHVVKMNLLDTLRDRHKLRNECITTRLADWRASLLY